jgi:predicted nucleic acid-binding protein
MKSSARRRTFAYFDTSVIVKNYIREAGSDRARQLLRNHRVVTSAIAALESMSAFRRNLASNVIDQADYSAILNRFQKDRGKLDVLELTDGILASAEQYVSKYNVRTLDAIHLATAMVTGVRFPKQLPFITGDSSQRDAGLQLGLKIVWVA